MRRPRAFVTRCVAVLVVGLAATGCYKYVPVQVGAVNPRADVRVVVTESAAARLSKDLGTYTTNLDGRVARELHDSVSVSVPVTRTYRGALMDSGWQTLFLGRAEVVQVHRRKLSRVRTVAASVGTAAVLALVVKSVVQWADPNTSNEEPPPPPPAQRVRFSASLRFPIR
ncbi:MAG TPA: hypothetical protein VJR92_10930 [Gemmatimonadaceae bacterium]|nr:hypothetical protein [Gemmatimonadaceae bacterium]